ncbi:type IV pilin protein [Acinetobacter schindleri]|uniref:type IV pilin protein n=1 Tax=Acinetobacter schindleri TaxID=108981 RepID=UPI0032B5D890
MIKPQIKNTGFTLIELMIVVVIVAVFAAIAIPSYQIYIAHAHRSKAQSEMLKIAERLENYKGKQLSYAGYIPDNQTLTKGEISIPYNTANNYDYKIQVVDINDSTKSLEESTSGQGWKMIASPNQTKNYALRNSEYIYLDSQGVKCMTKDSLDLTKSNCGNNTMEWK